jgi:hypothetical protein
MQAISTAAFLFICSVMATQAWAADTCKGRVTADAPSGPAYKEAKTLDLTEPFHTKTPWEMRIFQPTDAQSDISNLPVVVCLRGGRPAQMWCERMAEFESSAGDLCYPFQSFVGADIEQLSGQYGIKGVVVRTRFSGGVHTLQHTAIWVYDGVRTDGFDRVSEFDLGDIGEQRLSATVPLDGFFIKADYVETGPDESFASPHHYAVSVFQLDRRQPRAGYQEVLHYITSADYPNEDHHVIDGERGRIQRLMNLIYPHGPPW